MDIKYLAKLKDCNINECMCCQHFKTCHLVSKLNNSCFSFNEDILKDFLCTYEFYFSQLKDFVIEKETKL